MWSGAVAGIGVDAVAEEGAFVYPAGFKAADAVAGPIQQVTGDGLEVRGRFGEVFPDFAVLESAEPDVEGS